MDRKRYFIAKRLIEDFDINCFPNNLAIKLENYEYEYSKTKKDGKVS